MSSKTRDTIAAGLGISGRTLDKIAAAAAEAEPDKARDVLGASLRPF